MTNINLNSLKEKIEMLSKFHQIEILKILQHDDACTLNENTNGVFVNLTNVKHTVITELVNYLEYVKKQEKQLNDIESQKNALSNTYFKDIKDNHSTMINTALHVEH
jgi:uncharacterized membrane protein